METRTIDNKGRLSIFVTIIVPFYGPFSFFFNECITSLLSQSYTNFECLIVLCDSELKEYNDLHILDDKRIRMLQCMYADQSSKRNVGLKEAKGDYICFVDADDVLDTNFLSNSIKVIEKYKVDLVVFGLTRNDKDTLGKGFNNELSFINYDCKNLIYGEFYGNKDRNCIFFNSCCGKLFNRNVIVDNSILFKDGLKCAEDSVFVRTYGLYVNSMYINLDYLSYYWRQNPNSTSNTLNNGYFDIESYFRNIVEILFFVDDKYKIAFNDYVVNVSESRIDRMLTFYRNKIVTKNDIINCFKKNYKNAPIIKNAYKNIHKKGKTYNYIKFVILHNAFFLLRIYIGLLNVRKRYN